MSAAETIDPWDTDGPTPWDIDPKFRDWIRELDEDVIQSEYGYERGEFSNIPMTWDDARGVLTIGARTGAGPHIMAADEAVKATNTEVVSIELPRDTKGGAGHGSLIVLGGNDVSDVKRGIEVALKELDRTFGDVYGNEAGHIELQYTARASYALEKAFGAPLGRACGIIVGAPASVGVLMADTALKSANVEVVAYSSPAHGTSFSNEAILVISGDSGAVRQAVISAREIGKTVLATLGAEPKNDRPSYI